MKWMIEDNAADTTVEFTTSAKLHDLALKRYIAMISPELTPDEIDAAAEDFDGAIYPYEDIVQMNDGG